MPAAKKEVKKSDFIINSEVNILNPNTLPSFVPTISKLSLELKHMSENEFIFPVKYNLEFKLIQYSGITEEYNFDYIDTTNNHTDYDNEYEDEEKENTQTFCELAIDAINNGYTIIYDSWW